MVRTLVVIRHAKATEINSNVKDFDRPLTEKGKSDAIAMGVALKDIKVMPDVIISSPAKRTRQTAKRIAQSVGYDVDNIIWVEKLYHCTNQIIENIVSEVKNSVKTVFLVAHNPGISDFAYQIDELNKIEHLPPCGIVVAEINTDNWEDYSLAKRKVILIKFPLK